MKNSGCGYEITGKHGTQKNPRKNKKKTAVYCIPIKTVQST